MTLAAFRQLSPDEQKMIVIEAISRRLEHSKNLHFEIEILAWAHDNRDRPPIEPSDDPARRIHNRRFQAWLLDGSYFMERKTFSRQARSTFSESNIAESLVPVETVCTSWNAEVGVNRGHVRQSHVPSRTDARIDTKEDEMVVIGNRYWYWLDGKRSKFGEPFLQYLYNNRDEISVDATDENGETVTISVPWAPYWDHKPMGETRLLLDPAKGFMPVKTYGHWENAVSGIWRIQENIVIESRLIGDVWMPTNLQEVTRSNHHEPDTATVYSMTVLSIEQGTVRPEDLHVSFPEGATVIDAIKRAGYRVGKNGEETDVEFLVDNSEVFGANAVYTPCGLRNAE